MPAAIFLDRDGVIIANRASYVRTWADVEFLPGARAALAALKASTFKVIIVTNQSGIGRGVIDPQVAESINQQLVREIERSSGRIDAIYLCPHAPEAGCDCRKPRPGLILQAALDHNLDLQESILIGDNVSDLQAGQAAGIRRLALVRTGLGGRFVPEVAVTGPAGAEVFDDLAQAIDRWVLNPR